MIAGRVEAIISRLMALSRTQPLSRCFFGDRPDSHRLKLAD
jgi:hypothetical protein